jgi:hypothetical protein
MITIESCKSQVFQTGDILGQNIYPNYKWYNNTPLGFTIEILDIDFLKASIKITFD